MLQALLIDASEQCISDNLTFQRKY